MKLESGTIYSVHYRRYKVDPKPLILVLYSNKHICHAINLHYLHGKYSKQLIHMIAAIATKVIKFSSIYNHYHGWMKRYIPGVIKRAYRTYKPQHMTSIKPITKGYWGITTFLQEGQPKKMTTVQKRLSEKINIEKSKKIQTKQKSIQQLEKDITAYVDKIEAILSTRKEDQTKYTKI